MNMPQDAIDLIKKHEGFQPRPYLCPAGYRTIGYGHRILPGEVFDRMTGREAGSILLWDLQKTFKVIDEVVKVPLNDNQLSALLSFVYNVGGSAFKGSTLLKKLNDKKYKEAANQLLRWVYANQKELPGLVNRRMEERTLFLTEV